MADILNNNNQPVSTTPLQPDPAAPQVTQSTPAATEETGAQYEQNALAPEDLDARWLRWKCGVCNYTYEGAKPLKKCPRCGNEDQDKFLDAD